MIDIQEHTEPPRPHPVVIVKKMMRSAINGCNAAVPLSLISAGALCDLARLLRLRTGGCNLRNCARLFSACVCFCRACVCVFSMFGMQSMGIPARLHERTRLVCDDDADGVCVCVCVCVCVWV